jgi:hypothetical protein
MSCYILRDKLRNTKAGESDADKSEDFQIRVENAEREIKTWDWGAARYKYLCIAGSVVRNCRSIDQLFNCRWA